MEKLGDYWRQCKATRKQKMVVYNAIVKAKVMYGLESAHLTTAWLQKLNAFQLKGLRGILRMATTYIDRQNTNDEVIRRANECLGEGREIELFNETHNNRRMKLAAHLLRRGDDDPGRHCTYYPGTARPRENPCRRVGRPRIKWANATHSMLWRQAAPQVGEDEFDPDPASQWQQDWIHLLSLLRSVPV